MTSLRQCFSWWCFAGRGVDDKSLLRGAAEIGYEAVDLIPEELWPLATDLGLRVAAVNGHGTIDSGLNRVENAARIEKELEANIIKAATARIPLLICFSGVRNGLLDEPAIDQCARTLARMAPMARDAGVTLVLELLNSRVDHPDYQFDNIKFGVDVVERVNSSSVKLLYDIYHAQVMEGDIIRTIRTHHQHIGYYHTAGNPGRVQPDERQELNYRPIYSAILETGYTGFISHEFYPAGSPIVELRRAFENCAG